MVIAFKSNAGNTLSIVIKYSRKAFALVGTISIFWAMIWHLLAIVTVIFWGTSFVSTKVLIGHEFSAIQIFFIRFATTYLMLLIANHKKFRSDSWKDELKFALGGFTGCTTYFWAENSALTLSPSSNVSLIVCTNPLMIMIVGGLLYKAERLNRRQILGSIITFLGAALVVLNGKFILKLSPLGDLLAFGAAISWVIYAFSTQKTREKYSTSFAIRKVFFYGVLTSLPLFILDCVGIPGSSLFETAHRIPWEAFREPVVIGNFLCLCIFSNLFGYLIWNKVMMKLGTVLASNYIFAIPLITMITAVITIGEYISPMAIAGAAAIVAGMILAEYKKK